MSNSTVRPFPPPDFSVGAAGLESFNSFLMSVAFVAGALVAVLPRVGAWGVGALVVFLGTAAAGTVLPVCTRLLAAGAFAGTPVARLLELPFPDFGAVTAFEPVAALALSLETGRVVDFFEGEAAGFAAGFLEVLEAGAFFEALGFGLADGSGLAGVGFFRTLVEPVVDALRFLTFAFSLAEDIEDGPFGLGFETADLVAAGFTAGLPAGTRPDWAV